MRKVRPSQDIRPLSEFRANVAAYVEQVQTTRRPLVLTQHGRGAAVLLGIDEYERLLDQIEMQEDVRTAEAQIADGEGIAHGKTRAALRARLGAPAGARRRSA